MGEYLPILIVGAIIGVFAVIFLIAYALEKNKKETMGFDRHMADGEIIRRLMVYARPYWKQFVLVFLIMLLSIGYDLVSPLLVGHIEEIIKAEFELSYLFRMVAVYAGILIVSLICTYLQATL
ncbi:MAG: ABC transporter ATP-binding protein, partial [Clostridia bacterium]|nr:ABC transporter ATP-binding protein [Clostridia bacterium]